MNVMDEIARTMNYYTGGCWSITSLKETTSGLVVSIVAEFYEGDVTMTLNTGFDMSIEEQIVNAIADADADADAEEESDDDGDNYDYRNECLTLYERNIQLW